LVRSTDYEAPHNSVFSSRLLFHSAYLHTYSWAPHSPTVAFCVLFLKQKTKFTPKNWKKNYCFIFLLILLVTKIVTVYLYNKYGCRVLIRCEIIISSLTSVDTESASISVPYWLFFQVVLLFQPFKYAPKWTKRKTWGSEWVSRSVFWDVMSCSLVCR
jgi:hypothetical protein